MPTFDHDTPPQKPFIQVLLFQNGRPHIEVVVCSLHLRALIN